jgi:lycopene cyclase domain-containing protein
MEKYTYILVNLGSVLIPFIFSFHPKLEFNKKWRSTFLSLFIVAGFFIAWDVCYTLMEVWGFNPKYLIGINIFQLPLEEILFFFCIPYACLFTYHSIKIILPPFNFRYFKIVIILIIAMLMIFCVGFIGNWYTSVTFILLSLTLIYFQFILSTIWLRRFCFTSLVLILPFLIVNGILTGTGIDSEVVWYNNNEIMGYRFFTIPLEDFAYGFLMLLLNMYIFENYDYINNKNKLNLSS